MLLKELFLREDDRATAVFAFGRFNPPTIGHQKLLDKVSHRDQLTNHTVAKFKETVLIKANNLNTVQSKLINEKNELISSLEFWDKNCHALTKEEIDSDYVILLELVSQEKKEIENFLENISEKFGDSVSLLNSKQASKMWSARENIPVLLSDMNAYKLDICVPIKSLQKYLEDINALNLGVKIFTFGHLGDGNVHLNLVGDKKINESKNKIYEVTKIHSGSPSAEHGIGQRKKYIWTTFSDYSDKHELLKTLKKSIDPEPLSGKEIAKELSLSTSTVSRIIRAKYIQYDDGLLPMKSLLAPSVSKSKKITSRNLIREIDLLVKSSQKRLSDQMITNLLNKKGYGLARRTINKYRQKSIRLEVDSSKNKTINERS